MAKSLLLTGYPGIGKTTIIKQVATALGDRAGGFYTEEILGPGGRQGFMLFTLRGKQAIVAHKDLRDAQFPRVGRYGVDVGSLDRVGVRALRRAMGEHQIVVVDEIGTLTLYSRAFQDTLMEALMGRYHVIGTIAAGPHPEGDAFRVLAQVEVREVDRRNRDGMAERIAKWVAANVTGERPKGGGTPGI
ncbi:MAG: nucleoside-triphosphatase [Anaerolineae bacterium]|jgi:nucleoside-triphosphatase|nr:nucleoside-triphosphatase [Anaerolineae bacterium]